MDDKYGVLFVCATPVGNLKDITIRALETLESCDYVAAEDTRRTLKLLNHYNIKARLISCHEHNERKRAEELIGLLKAGNNIALVSDAGMPAVSDPGGHIIALCYEHGIMVTVCPGASASVSALVLSGFNGAGFVFEGFLPTSKKERHKKLTELKGERRPIVLYEAPHRIKRTLTEILEHIGDRELAIVREMTKIHEEVLRLYVSAAVKHYEENEPRGEFALVLKGSVEADEKPDLNTITNSITIEEHYGRYLKEGLNEMDAIKRTAKDRGAPKSAIYDVIKGKKRV